MMPYQILYDFLAMLSSEKTLPKDWHFFSSLSPFISLFNELQILSPAYTYTYQLETILGCHIARKCGIFLPSSLSLNYSSDL